MNLNCNYGRGLIELSMESYISKLKEEYPEIIKEDDKKVKVPYIYQYKVDPRTDELNLTKQKLKQKVKFLAEIEGKLNYMRTRGRLDLEFAVGKLARLVLDPHERVIEAAHKLL
ncbi:Tkp4 protein [Vanderwaltozyma polyspora DSM 70294]|uniref:Tkp4 protein n=1 Tax=Vanderwaltozyma polyspora (strain ATCC 22028 / DSM 70294 / BCRC 21397 / CBS 2163 / NBRC 10782 / NRRL Y-8283 / UCD 57-17) TaxID=436907 RepID=A7TQ36_VANPO|nr:Tkp4 protein [Vanderwaltozyma polyspora DSM 70294]EDO15641.1 Tkp4 protein [Vanderwaltozyma polyspora DSM 70294]